jgi:hypothetical protein
MVSHPGDGFAWSFGKMRVLQLVEITMKTDLERRNTPAATAAAAAASAVASGADRAAVDAKSCLDVARSGEGH